jgi:hypothetical protein
MWELHVGRLVLCSGQSGHDGAETRLELAFRGSEVVPRNL